MAERRTPTTPVQMRPPFIDKESQQLFAESVNVQRFMLEDLMTNISIVAVVLIVILGIVVWNNQLQMKVRLLITLGSVLVTILLVQLLQYRMRESFLKIQQVATKMILDFTQMNRIDGMANDFELSMKTWDSRKMLERNRSQRNKIESTMHR